MRISSPFPRSHRPPAGNPGSELGASISHRLGASFATVTVGPLNLASSSFLVQEETFVSKNAFASLQHLIDNWTKYRTTGWNHFPSGFWYLALFSSSFWCFYWAVWGNFDCWSFVKAYFVCVSGSSLDLFSSPGTWNFTMRSLSGVFRPAMCSAPSGPCQTGNSYALAVKKEFL